MIQMKVRINLNINKIFVTINMIQINAQHILYLQYLNVSDDLSSLFFVNYWEGNICIGYNL
jgi:hypothetical protein